MVRSNSISILHRFRCITPFTVYVTACDLEKSLSFDTTVQITSHVRFPIHVEIYHRLVNTCYTFRGMGIKKVSNSKSDLYNVTQ